MKNKKKEEEPWETPSLEWIHRVRRTRQLARKGRRIRPMSRTAAENLAGRYGLKLGRPSFVRK